MLVRQKLFNCNERKYIYMLLSTWISCNFKFTIYFFLCLATRYRVHEKLVVAWLVSTCCVVRGTQKLVNCVQRILSLFFFGTKLVQFMPFQPILRSILILSSHIWVFSVFISFIWIFSNLFDQPNNIWCRV